MFKLKVEITEAVQAGLVKQGYEATDTNYQLEHTWTNLIAIHQLTGEIVYDIKIKGLCEICHPKNGCGSCDEWMNLESEEVI